MQELCLPSVPSTFIVIFNTFFHNLVLSTRARLVFVSMSWCCLQEHVFVGGTNRCVAGRMEQGRRGM